MSCRLESVAWAGRSARTKDQQRLQCSHHERHCAGGRARFTLWARVLYDAQCAAGEKIKVSIVPSLSGCDMGLQQRYAKIRDDLIKEHTRGRGCDDPRLLVAFRDAWETICNMDTNEDAWTKSFEQGARVSFE